MNTGLYGKILSASGALIMGIATAECQSTFRPFSPRVKHLHRSTVYDDFSRDTLNTNKWSILIDYEGHPLTDYYGVSNGVFYAGNTNALDKRTLLSLQQHQFLPGEILEYDFSCTSGSGEHGIDIFINGQLLSNLSSQERTGIGISEQYPLQSDLIGNYHVSLEFANSGIDFQFKNLSYGLSSRTFAPFPRPEEGTIDVSGDSPYSFGVKIWSRGSIHATFDNFVISEPHVIPPLINLEPLIFYNPLLGNSHPPIIPEPSIIPLILLGFGSLSLALRTKKQN